MNKYIKSILFSALKLIEFFKNKNIFVFYLFMERTDFLCSSLRYLLLFGSSSLLAC